jgi:penicillin-binding protein 2A
MTNEEFEEQQSSSEQDSQWQKQVDDFTDKAKDSLSEFGNKVKDATKDIFNSIWGKIQGE